MTCKEFKEKVVDLFDKDVDVQKRADCEAHMAGCDSCKQFYEELKETFAALQPRDRGGKKSVRPLKPVRRRKYRQAAAAVILFLAGVATGAGYLFSTPATAADAEIVTLDQAVRCVQNVGSFAMKVYARTSPGENFAYFHPDSGFVEIDVKLLRQNDSTFYRVEKEKGRTVVFDGTHQYAWVPGVFFCKGGPEAGFLDRFSRILYPDRLLALQEEAVRLQKKNMVTRTERAGDVTLTVEGLEKNHDLEQLFRKGTMDNCPVTIENRFSKADGLLRSVRVWTVWKGQKVMLLRVDGIAYNVELSRKSLTALPEVDASKWQDVETPEVKASLRRLRQLRREKPEAAARRIMTALATGKTETAREALQTYDALLDDLIRKYKGCAVSDFATRRTDDYAGVYVFYTLTTPDGKTSTQHIAIRNDNNRRIWQVDGGL